MSQPTVPTAIRRIKQVALAAALLAALALPASAGGAVPKSIRARVPVIGVSCKAGCCCGSTDALYHGHWYSRPMGYCRWFRPLREGQIVLTTLYLWR